MTATQFRSRTIPASSIPLTGRNRVTRTYCIGGQARDGGEDRTWKCPDCGFRAHHGYEALADVGSPVCPDSDTEMLRAEADDDDCLALAGNCCAAGEG